jgi:3-hydroxyisobutyrate dehydrogenase
MDAVSSSGSTAPLGSHAAEIYAEFIKSDAPNADKDFSAVIDLIRNG